MKALKSKLVDQILRSGVKIPLRHGAKFAAVGVGYMVNFVPKARSS
jgi:hypothetical protein